MDFRAVVVTSALWMFVFRKVPSWAWFGGLKRRFPRPLDALWNGWTECAYCGGFWIALAVRAGTRLDTIGFPAGVPVVADWFLDALATALGVLFVIRVLDALAAAIRMGPGEH